jgi:hypothetical protein
MFGFATANPKHAFEALEAHFRKKKKYCRLVEYFQSAFKIPNAQNHV